jgi:Pyruvate/2-oxoacid:ferredoxin oxidoreductase delta subunit
MEGYGPTNGVPKKVGLIISGANPYELDVVASGIVGLKPDQVPTIRASVERGLCSGTLSSINMLGESFSEVIVDDFKKPTTQLSFNFYSLLLPKFISKRISIFLKPKPKFNYSICKGCEMCAKSCPPKAITMIDGKPHVDYSKCIRCFCCHELCNYNAVAIKRPWFLKLLLK